ncbi:unnamed protein product [Diatraea saccharalis]|uniref:Uncharacterized protein n=1 Tax=Diatraea saccharalis TaxID=40085 RepID=A0A9N9R2E9_9NEOP|nr:unnamed protein product [Diatraea saccharalis]
MAVYRIILVVLIIATIVHSQRPSFAGTRPIGYPALETANTNQLSNRFGEDLPVPIETKGDRRLINKIESLPTDNKPFWYLNMMQYNALRQRPQTWPVRANNFIS